MDNARGARLTMQRRLAWNETDAAGHNHFSAAVRWLEEAEHELMRRLGLTDTIPRTPRVHIEFDYRDRLWFGDRLDVTVQVAEVGRASCTIDLEVRTERGVAITGRETFVHVGGSDTGSAPWDDRTRALLLGETAPEDPDVFEGDRLRVVDGPGI